MPCKLFTDNTGLKQPSYLEKEDICYICPTLIIFIKDSTQTSWATSATSIFHLINIITKMQLNENNIGYKSLMKKAVLFKLSYS